MGGIDGGFGGARRAANSQAQLVVSPRHISRPWMYRYQTAFLSCPRSATVFFTSVEMEEEKSRNVEQLSIMLSHSAYGEADHHEPNEKLQFSYVMHAVRV